MWMRSVSETISNGNGERPDSGLIDFPHPVVPLGTDLVGTDPVQQTHLTDDGQGTQLRKIGLVFR
ncbi:hypothetical protein TYRP_006287 [Tyrophagus putrescentiae]|nr:hypothetical protein TYRP_006287 [Tyrophagus putrescentiae]